MKIVKSVSFKLEESKVKTLDEIAKGLGVTRAALIRMMMLEGIEKYEKSGRNPRSFLERS